MYDRNSMFLVLGGKLASIGGVEFENMAELDLIGVYDNFDAAEKIWRAKAQATVDDAMMCYRVVALPQLISPNDTIDDFLQRHPVSPGLRIQPDVTVKEVCRQMNDMRVGSACIVEAGAPVGIFTERDLSRLVANEPQGWSSAPITQFMSRPQTVKLTDLLIDGLMLMQKGHFRHLPVIDAQGLLRNVISIRDFAFRENSS